MNWTISHSAIILALLAVVFLHVKGEPSWAAVVTPESIGELGGQVLTVVGAMFAPALLKPKWDGTDRRNGV